jgi:hypothetical protein
MGYAGRCHSNALAVTFHLGSTMKGINRFRCEGSQQENSSELFETP